MSTPRRTRHDVVIVGSGFAGANLAWILARAGKRVLVLEAGPGLDAAHGEFLERYVLSTLKTPSAPYPPDAGALDPSRTNAPRPTAEAMNGVGVLRPVQAVEGGRAARVAGLRPGAVERAFEPREERLPLHGTDSQGPRALRALTVYHVGD